jgi:hypothetical protein
MAIATGSGVLRLDDAVEAASALWRTPGWRGRSVVWDLREGRFDISSADAETAAQFVLRRQPSPPPRRVAFVTGRDVDFGMARVFEVYRQSEATEFRVFRDYDEAVTWARSPGPP